MPDYERNEKRQLLYVAGPVLRSGLLAEDLNNLDVLYGRIESWCQSRHIDVILPRETPEFEQITPREFVKLISDLIDAASCVLAVLVVPGASAGGEAVWAANRGKPLGVLMPPGKRVPRLLAGQESFRGSGTPGTLELLLDRLIGTP